MERNGFIYMLFYSNGTMVSKDSEMIGREKQGLWTVPWAGGVKR